MSDIVDCWKDGTLFDPDYDHRHMLRCAVKVVDKLEQLERRKTGADVT